MATAPATKWFIEADYIQACNCDYGCPCEFEAPPTMGFCQGMGAWRINKGKYGDVTLDGLALYAKTYFCDIGSFSSNQQVLSGLPVDLNNLYIYPYTGNTGGHATVMSNSWDAGWRARRFLPRRRSAL